jgi:hypothetical protein
MRRDLLATDREQGAGIPGHGECPGASPLGASRSSRPLCSSGILAVMLLGGEYENYLAA